jgi:drug/metabolite transporter (DMT)-like permease
VFNRVLRTTSPTVVSIAILFEVPGAAILAALWLGQTPPVAAVPALALLLAGIALVIGAREPSGPEAAPPVLPAE